MRARSFLDFPGPFVAFSVLLVALAYLLAGCHWPAPSPVPGPDASDAGASSAADCDPAEARLSALACRYDSGAAVIAGAPGEWAAICRRALADGRDWHPRCLARIADCGEREAAYRGRSCR